MTATPVAGAVEAASAEVTNESSQRFRELVDEIGRKDSALEQYRALFETMTRDYEVAQRRGERMQLEFETLTTKHGVLQQELLAVKAKSALQESRIKQDDDEWERRTRQLRQEFAAVVEERDVIAKEREAQWQQARILRSKLDEQRRQHSEAEREWACRMEEARKETEDRVRASLREREDLLQLRETELQRGASQLEGRFADVSAETRRLQLSNEALELRVEELQRCLRRQEEITQRLQDAHSVVQREKAQLGECMALERQTYRQRLEHTENSFRAQVQELQRLCEQLVHERERAGSESARALRESQQELQRAREVWLQQQQQLELTVESVRGDLTRARMRFDSADESRQRAEALLARTRRELEASQQQEASLQETIAALHREAAKRVAAQERLENETTRLLAAVAERERETERWRAAVERMEWRARLENAHNEKKEEEISRTMSAALPPPPPLPLPASSAAPRGLTRKASWATPCRQVQHAESIDRTSPIGSPIVMDANHLSCPAEDKDVDLLRTLVQEVLQECVAHMDSPPSLTPASTSATAAAAGNGGQDARTPRRRGTSSRMRRQFVSSNTRPGDDSPRNGVSLPSPITRDVPFCAAAKPARPTSAVAPVSTGSLPSTTTSPDSSMLRARAPLFVLTANNSSFDSSTKSKPRRRLSASQGHQECAPPPADGSSLAVLPADREPDNTVAAAVVQRYAREREEVEREMRRTLRDLEQRQQQILSSIASGNGAETYNTSRLSSVATTSSSSITGHVSSPSSSSARASTAAPAPPSRLLALQERFATMPVV